MAVTVRLGFSDLNFDNESDEIYFDLPIKKGKKGDTPSVTVTGAGIVSIGAWDPKTTEWIYDEVDLVALFKKAKKKVRKAAKKGERPVPEWI